MKDRANFWTPEEIKLLRSGLKPRQIVNLLPGRSYGAILSKRAWLRENGMPMDVEVEELNDEEEWQAVSKPREVYQFIKIAEATPERKKLWEQR